MTSTLTTTTTTTKATTTKANKSFHSGAFVVQLGRTLRRETRRIWQREADRNTASEAEDRCAKKGRSSVCIAPKPPSPSPRATTIGHRSMRSDLCLSSTPLCELINHPQAFAFSRARERRGGKARASGAPAETDAQSFVRSVLFGRRGHSRAGHGSFAPGNCCSVVAPAAQAQPSAEAERNF